MDNTSLTQILINSSIIPVWNGFKKHWLAIILISIFICIIVYITVWICNSEEDFTIDRTDLIKTLVDIKDELPGNFNMQDVINKLKSVAGKDSPIVNAFDAEVYYHFKKLYEDGKITMLDLYKSLYK